LKKTTVTTGAAEPTKTTETKKTTTTKTRTNPTNATAKNEKITETSAKRRNEGTGSKTKTKTEAKTTTTGTSGGQTGSTSTTTKTTTTKTSQQPAAETTKQTSTTTNKTTTTKTTTKKTTGGDSGTTTKTEEGIFISKKCGGEPLYVLYILNIPLLLNEIFQFMEKDDIKCLSMCCKKIYEFLNSDGLSYKDMVDNTRVGDCIICQKYTISKKRFDVRIIQTQYDPEKYWTRGSNIFEFFDVIDW
jgi:hypothetical protein